MKIEEFVEENIEEINHSIGSFKVQKGREYSDIDIKQYLKSKIFDELYMNPNQLEQILEEFSKYDFKKTKVEILANKYIYYKSDLFKLIKQLFFAELNLQVEKNDEIIINHLMKNIFETIDMDERKQKYVSRDLRRVLSKSLFIATTNGFPVNIINVESGTMTANAGDSAQFLFLSRAILAGYNASNVDVRSSRYDTIIDYKGKLLKVQVKGISSDIISFKDRDRGGQGIDHNHERNKGKRITSKDCDIYVAVDKQVGICYLIPMNVIDTWPDEKINAVKTSELLVYKENWKVIDNMALA
jgi:hypothetical protein